MLAPYESVPTTRAAAITTGWAVIGARSTPSARFVAPASAPFQSVVSAGLTPSISDVMLLSRPQHRHAAAVSPPARIPGVPPRIDRRIPAPTVAATPVHPNF